MRVVLADKGEDQLKAVREVAALFKIIGDMDGVSNDLCATIAATIVKEGRREVSGTAKEASRRQSPDGTFKNTIIQDLKANGVDLASATQERAVLPMGGSAMRSTSPD